MFGGLSVKGESKEAEESAAAAPAAAAAGSSGFSFLQSAIGGAPSTPSAAPAASSAAPSSGEAAAEGAAALGMAGSAFGFLASTPTPAAAPSASASPASNVAEAAAPAASAFGFMSGAASSTAPEETSSDAAAASPALAPRAAPSMFAGLTTATEKSNEPAASNSESSAPGSGFSFLSSPAPAAAEPTMENVEAASTTSTAGSSFSFVNGMAGGTEHEEPAKESSEAPLEAVQEKESAAGSGFSFLSGASAPLPTPADTVSTPSVQPPSLVPEATTPIEPAAPAPGGDLLSVSNPSMPVGAGVSWSAPKAGGAKKVVKKKRGKRVGVGSAAAAGAASIPDPQASVLPDPQQQPGSFQPPAMPGAEAPPGPPPSQWGTPATPAMPSTPAHGATEGTLLPDSPPMRIKAERALDRAEEFLQEKQRRSALALAAERAVLDKGGAGSDNGGGWKLDNDDDGGAPDSPRDETYMAAKAAAREARKLADHPPKHGKQSLFSNIFGRNKGGSSSAIPSHSAHGGVVGGGSPVPGRPSLAMLQRGGSNGSAASGSPVPGMHPSPLPATKELSDPPSYGSPRPDEGAEDDEKRNEREFAQETHRLEAEKRQRDAEAEERRQEEERKSREEADRSELERKQEEERERRRSPRQKMQSILDRLADAARTSSDAVSALREARKELVTKKAEAEKAERYAAQQRKFAEAQQTLAAEAEDFEEADRLGTVIEQHAQERREHAKKCAAVGEAMAKLDEEREAASKAVAGCFATAVAQLGELEDVVEDKEREEGVLEQFAATSQRLSHESERLARDVRNIERDEGVLKEEQDELAKTIGEETRDVDEQRAAASTKLDEVNQTIADLRAQLMEAEAAAFDLATEIKAHDQSIDAVKSKYARQIGRLAKKEQSVTEARADWESERASVAKAQAAHEAVVAAHAEDMLRKERLLGDIKAESAAATEFEEIVSGAFADVAGLNGEGAVGEGADEVLKYEAAVSEANQNLVAAEAHLQDLEEELSAIEVRVPVLESEKKAAAAQRDFKAAGKASKEIKDALARREECAAELAGAALEKRDFAQDELATIAALLEEKRAAAAERGREAGVARMGRLREKIDALASILKKSLNGNATDEDAINVACVGAFVVEGQIRALEGEGEALGAKWGGWEADDDASVQSAPTFESNDGNEATTVDREVLEKYLALRQELGELSAAVEEAAAAEDFEKADALATTLEEKMQSLGGFPLSDLEAALKNRPSAAEKEDEGEADAEEASSEKSIDDDVLEKYSSLCDSIKATEAYIEIAVADEDFEKAAELEEQIQSAQAEVDSLGFPADDLEEALRRRDADIEGEKDSNDADETAADETAADEKVAEEAAADPEDEDSSEKIPDDHPASDKESGDGGDEEESSEMNGNASAQDEGGDADSVDTAAEPSSDED
ncbi:hypothetical protein ACHAXT_006266 [Thalassiosira profunda]